MKPSLRCILLLCTCLCPSVLLAELKVPGIFSNHMVLQRDKPVPVWGWADPGAEVTVEFADTKKVTTVVGADKAWRVVLDPMRASAEPRSMKITSTGHAESLIFSNILVGDVWLCSGQSNMEMPVGHTVWGGGALNYEEEIRNSANPLLRQFAVARNVRADGKIVDGTWTSAGPDTTGDFSAIGYFFAREIQRNQKVPVAIIKAAIGATPIEAWISREKLLSDPEIAETAAKQAEDVTVGAKRRNAEYLAAHAVWREKYSRTDPGAPEDAHAIDSVSPSDIQWKPVTLPGSSSKIGARQGGIVWFRREVEIPSDDTEGLWVTLPAVRDFFTLYFNGVKLHATSVETGRRLLYAARLPKQLIRNGKNVLAIRLQTYSGAGAIGGVTERFRISKSHVGGSEGIPLYGDWLCRVESEYAPYPRDAEREPVEAPGIGVYYHYTSGCYTMMISPLATYSLAGVVWYQGEHNAGRAPEYQKLLKMLITEWRQRWAMDDMPFYICQLPNNGKKPQAPEESGWVELREAQGMAQELPRVYVANLIDTAEDGDLHPRNKQDAGHRVALLARAHSYGDKSVACRGPVFDSMKIQGGTALVRFKHAEGGLVARKVPATYRTDLKKPDSEIKTLELPSPDSEVQGFAIYGETAGPDGGTGTQWVWANAKILSDSTVEVWSEKVKKPLAVRYAWANNPVCNLYNKAGLPAYQFRSKP